MPEFPRVAAQRQAILQQREVLRRVAVQQQVALQQAVILRPFLPPSVPPPPPTLKLFQVALTLEGRKGSPQPQLVKRPFLPPQLAYQPFSLAQVA